MESKCLTHLGHNLPEGDVDRYCIDLVCIAGSPLDVSESELTQQFPSLSTLSTTTSDAAAATTTTTIDTDFVATETTSNDTKKEEMEDDDTTFLTSENLDPNTYESSAELNFGNDGNKTRNVIIGVAVSVVVVLTGLIAVGCVSKKKKSTKNATYATKTLNDDNTTNNTNDDEKTNEDEVVSSSSSV